MISPRVGVDPRPDLSGAAGVGAVAALPPLGNKRQQVSSAGTLELSEGDSAKALRASIDAEKLLAWNALAVNERARNCGLPFGLGDRHYEPWPYRRVFDGASTCSIPACPACGREILLRRWALTTLATADHLAGDGTAWFVSIAGQHDRDEDVADKAERLRTVLELVVTKAFRDWRDMLGLRGWVRVIEPTFGGASGTHPNAHFLVLLEDTHLGGWWQDPGHMLAGVIRHELIRWALGKRLNRYNAERWELVNRFLGENAIDCLPAGVAAAGYLAKLTADAGEVAGIGFELTDPSGSKDRGGIGDRAWCGWAIRRAREAGYGGRRLRAGLVAVPELAETAGQYREWTAVTKGWKLYAHSKGLFSKYEELSLDALLERASKVAAAEDWQAVLVILGLADPDPAGGAVTEEDIAGGPFDDEAPAEPPPVPPDELVRLDARALAAWFDDLPAQTLGGIDGAVCTALTLDGPWRTVLDIAEAARRNEGLELIVLEHVALDDEDPPTVWLTRPEEDMGGCWERVDWPEVRRRAGRSRRYAFGGQAAA